MLVPACALPLRPSKGRPDPNERCATSDEAPQHALSGRISRPRGQRPPARRLSVERRRSHHARPHRDDSQRTCTGSSSTARSRLRRDAISTASGAVVVKLPSQSPSSLCRSQAACDRLVVTDADSGKSFSTVIRRLRDTTGPPTGDPAWGTVSVGDSSWRNYTVDAYFKNPSQASIMVDSADPQQRDSLFVPAVPSPRQRPGLPAGRQGSEVPRYLDPTGPARVSRRLDRLPLPGLELSKQRR